MDLLSSLRNLSQLRFMVKCFLYTEGVETLTKVGANGLMSLTVLCGQC